MSESVKYLANMLSCAKMCKYRVRNRKLFCKYVCLSKKYSKECCFLSYLLS